MDGILNFVSYFIGTILAVAATRGAANSLFRFHLAVTPSLALLGVGWSLGMGLIGGLLPAVRAARVPVTVALRAT